MFTDYLIWKAIAIVVAAFIWGIWRGFNGLPLGVERPDSPTEPKPDH